MKYYNISLSELVEKYAKCPIIEKADFTKDFHSFDSYKELYERLSRPFDYSELNKTLSGISGNFQNSVNGGTVLVPAYLGGQPDYFLLNSQVPEPNFLDIDIYLSISSKRKSWEIQEQLDKLSRMYLNKKIGSDTKIRFRLYFGAKRIFNQRKGLSATKKNTVQEETLLGCMQVSDYDNRPNTMILNLLSDTALFRFFTVNAVTQTYVSEVLRLEVINQNHYNCYTVSYAFIKDMLPKGTIDVMDL